MNRVDTLVISLLVRELNYFIQWPGAVGRKDIEDIVYFNDYYVLNVEGTLSRQVEKADNAVVLATRRR